MKTDTINFAKVFVSTLIIASLLVLFSCKDEELAKTNYLIYKDVEYEFDTSSSSLCHNYKMCDHTWFNYTNLYCFRGYFLSFYSNKYPVFYPYLSFSLLTSDDTNFDDYSFEEYNGNPDQVAFWTYGAFQDLETRIVLPQEGTFIKGSINVKRLSNNEYSIQFSLYDTENNLLKGNYTGELIIVNWCSCTQKYYECTLCPL